MKGVSPVIIFCKVMGFKDRQYGQVGKINAQYCCVTSSKNYHCVPGVDLVKGGVMLSLFRDLTISPTKGFPLWY